MGAMLVVSDLERSVRFYRDLVGLRLLDQAANTAVLSYGGGRVLLRQLADMSQWTGGWLTCTSRCPMWTPRTATWSARGSSSCTPPG